MNKIELKAEKRKVTGRKVKNLRKGGMVPANIYGKDVKSLSIQVNTKDFRKVFEKAGETGVVAIALGKEEKPVLVHNVQVHPATDEILHVDFLQVDLKAKVTANIPVELKGESPAEKSGIGTAVLLIQELEVEALPTDMISSFEIDAAKLTEVDQVVKISDLKYDKEKIEIKMDAETVVAKVEPPQKEEIIQPAEPVVEETKEGEEKKPEGGETETPKDQAPAEQK